MCTIHEESGTQRLHCFATFSDLDTHILSKQIPQGTWHTERIEADPSTMTFSFYVDGLKAGVYTPDRAVELKGALFDLVIGSGCGGSLCTDKSKRTVVSYFDSVRIGAVADDPLVYDSFDQPTYNGSFDPSKWEVCGSDPGSKVNQENGVLSMTHAGSSSGLRATSLCARKYWAVKISEPTYFEADLMFPDKQMGMVDITVGTNGLSGAGCFHHYLYTNNRYITILHCNYVSGQASWISRIKNVAPGTWHTVRIEVEPATGDFVYYLDGQQYDSYHASPDFSQTKFWFSISVSAESPHDVIGYIDNVKIGQISK
jgi:hypothetical protein